MKEYKKTMLITSFITTCPILFGIFIWNKLPDKIATHFDFSGVANGWSSKAFAVFFIPLFLLLMQWICFFATSVEPKTRNINPKIKTLVLWIIPMVSLVENTCVYSIALGRNFDIGAVTNLLIGTLFLVLGNYIHKIKQNYTFGIRIPWTLDNEENWNRTHRVSAWIFIAAGILFMANAYLKSNVLLIVIIIAIIVIPMGYSYLLYKRKI